MTESIVNQLNNTKDCHVNSLQYVTTIKIAFDRLGLLSTNGYRKNIDFFQTFCESDWSSNIMTPGLVNISEECR